MIKRIIVMMLSLLYFTNCFGNNSELVINVSRNYHFEKDFDYVPLADFKSEFFKRWKESEISEDITIYCKGSICILTERIKNNNGEIKKEVKKKTLNFLERIQIENRIKKIKEFAKKIKKEEKEISKNRADFKEGKVETVKYEYCKYKNNISVSINPIVYNTVFKKIDSFEENNILITGCLTEDVIDIIKIFGYQHDMLRKQGEIREEDYKNFSYSEILSIKGRQKEWNIICRDLKCRIMFTVRNSKEKLSPIDITLNEKKKKEVVEKIFKGMEWEERVGPEEYYYPSSQLDLNNGKIYYYRGGTYNTENKEFYKVLDELLEKNHKEIEDRIY